MNRVYKECVFFSAAAHAALVLALAAGAAFLKQRPRIEPPTAVLTFIPDELVDRPIVSPPPAPPAPRRRTPPAKPTLPAKQTPPARRTSPSPKPASSRPSSKPRPERTKPKWTPSEKITVNLKPTVRRRSPAKPKPAPAASKPDPSARLLQRAIQNVARLAAQPSTAIETVGGATRTYADYGLYVKMIYDRAWRPPRETGKQGAAVKARVVIGRDGRVLSARIVQPSGDPALDRSVRDCLDRVKSIGKPFPKGAKEDRRAFLINFKLRAVESLG